MTTTTSANNGASPTWCVGAPLVVRLGDTVWASISIHDADAPPYCNTHWELWRRPARGGWEKVRAGSPATEREPCPLFLLDPKSLVVSIQPKILERGRDGGGETAWFCQPALAVFDPQRPAGDTREWTPEFSPGAPFAQHSYRSLGIDAADHSLLMLVIDRRDIYRPTWRDRAGSWHPLKPLTFPVRACYPDVVFHNRTGHVLAMGDIPEPNEAWKAEKMRVLHREWDYVFRRLFYTWSPDLAAEDFRAPLELDSVEDTGGWMFNMDMLVDRAGRVHLLWVRRLFDYGFLRDRFFPGQPNIESVMHAVVEGGRVVARETLLQRELSDEETERRRVTTGRLHELPDGRLIAVFARENARKVESTLWLQEIDPLARSSPAAVPVETSTAPPTGWFFTNTPRGGSAPARDLDLLGTETKDGVVSVRHLHLRIP